MNKLQFSGALEALWTLVRRSNKYIDENTPWTLAKSEDKKGRLGTVLYNLCESLRFIGVLLLPFMPRTPGRIWAQLGMDDISELQNWQSLTSWGLLKPGTRAERQSDLFPRLDIEKELKVLLGEKEPEAGKVEEKKKVQDKKADIEEKSSGKKEGKMISIDEFSRVEIRVGEIISAEPVPKTDKLLVMKVNVGEEEPRQIVAGIAQFYPAEELPGKKALFVVNLQPVKLRGCFLRG